MGNSASSVPESHCDTAVSIDNLTSLQTPYGLSVDRAVLCLWLKPWSLPPKDRCHYCYFAGPTQDTTSSMAPACPICYVEYDRYQAGLRPRVLPCGHTLCTECLGKCSLGEITSILPHSLVRWCLHRPTLAVAFSFLQLPNV